MNQPTRLQRLGDLLRTIPDDPADLHLSREDIARLALEEMEIGEQRTTEAHIASCPDCANQLALLNTELAYWDTVEGRGRIATLRVRVFLREVVAQLCDAVNTALTPAGVVLAKAEPSSQRGEVGDGLFVWAIDRDPHTKGVRIVVRSSRIEELSGCRLRLAQGSWNGVLVLKPEASLGCVIGMLNISAEAAASLRPPLDIEVLPPAGSD